MDKEKLMKFIAQAESSGGKFRNHPTVDSGVQSGTHAVSTYGIMPNTVWEMAQRNKDFQSTPSGQAILESQGNSDRINEITANPYADHEIMSGLMDDTYNRLSPYLDKTDNPEGAMLFAHRRGVGAAVNALQKRGQGYLDDPYVKNYFQDDQTKQNIDPEDLDNTAKIRALTGLMNNN